MLKLITKRRTIIAGLSLVLALVMVFSGITVVDRLTPTAKSSQDSVLQVSLGQKVLTIKTAEASGAADYTCLGVNDNVIFQTAINALPASGGKISVLGGTYSFSTTINLRSNVYLEGVGSGTIIRIANATNINAVTLSGTANVTIANLAVDGNKANNPVSGTGVLLTGAGTNGCLLTRVFAHDFILDNLSIESTVDGVNTIRDCASQSAGRDGVSLGGAYSRVINTSSNSNGRFGFIPAGSGIVLESPYAANNTGQGIYATGAVGVKITDPIILNNVGGGIKLTGSPKSTITNPTAIGNGHPNIAVHFSSDNSSVVGGFVSFSLGDGVDIHKSSGVSVESVTSQFNVGEGFTADSASPLCSFVGNHAVFNGLNGFHISKSRYSRVVGNEARNNGTVAANTYDGISLQGDATPVTGLVTYNIIEGNTAIDDQGIGATQRSGIRESVAGANYNLITNNQVSGNIGTQIYKVGADTSVNHNSGFVTENKGTGTIITGGTSVVVNHGLNITPVVGDIWVTPTSIMGNASYLYVDTYTSANFTAHSNVDPATANITFAWGKN